MQSHDGNDGDDLKDIDGQQSVLKAEVVVVEQGVMSREGSMSREKVLRTKSSGTGLDP